MLVPGIADDDAAIWIERMRDFFRASQIISLVVFISGTIIGALVIATWLALPFLAAVGANIAVVEWCHRRVKPCNSVRIGLIASYSNWILVIAVAPLVSFSLPVLLMPVLITMLAMAPMLNRSAAIRFIALGSVAIAAIAILALSIEGPIDAEIPDNLGDVIVVVGLVMFTVPLGFLAWDTHVRHAVAIDRMVDTNNALRSSRSRLVEIADTERRALERNLHDGAQQRLVSLAMRLRLLGSQHPEVVGSVDGLLTELDAALAELRDLSHGLSPPLLEARGLPDALSAAARRSALQVEVTASNVGRYRQSVETAVYFCALEALQNASKHAGADAQVSIELAAPNGTLTMVIQDDGAGFDVDTMATGVGLRNMADRLGAVDGTLAVDSSPSEGTRVTVVIRTPDT